MTTETVIITGESMEVDHQTSGQPDPKRRRPQTYDPPKSTVDLGAVIEQCRQGNPFWSDEANEAAETSNEKPRRLAKAWAKHRIETP